jgi:hypothetical protein
MSKKQQKEIELLGLAGVGKLPNRKRDIIAVQFT